MKTRLFLSLFILTLFSFSNSAIAQCDIVDLRVENLGCNPNGSFDVRLTFMDSDQDLKQYIVQGNGQDYGTFDYDNGIKISDLDGNCVTPFEFVVRDANNPNCGAFVDLGVVCCGGTCNLEVKVNELSNCRGGDVYDIVFDVKDFPPNSPGFHVITGNIQIASFDYTDPNPQLTLAWNGEDETTLILCDNFNPLCCDTISYIPPCVCNIFDMQWDVIDCDPVDSSFNFILNADFQSVSDSFTVGGNANNYGNYSFSELPITLGPFKYGTDQKFDFLIADLSNLFCFDFVEPGKIEGCPQACSIDATIVEGTCNNDQSISFFVTAGGQRTGVLGYEVSHNASIIDTFSYSSANNEIGPFPSNCNDSHEIQIRDLYHPFCDTTTFSTSLCCIPDCEINDLVVTVNCNNNGGDGFMLDFNTNLDSNEIFQLLIDDVSYGNYTAGDLPINDNTFMFSNGSHRFVVSARDSMCLEDINVMVDCTLPCDLGQIFFNVGECDLTGRATISFSFDAFQSPSDSFDLVINGTVVNQFGYNENYEVSVLADCNTVYDLQVIDSQDPSCSNGISIDPICCAMCENEITQVELGDCDDTQRFTANVFVSANATAGASFELRGNGTSYGIFDYANSPIEVSLLGDCSTLYEFIIIDQDDLTCQSEYVLTDTICCVPPLLCEINISNIQVGDCDSNGMVTIELTIENNTETSDSFDLVGNFMEYGTFSYSDSPINIMVPGDCQTIYEFIVSDVLDNNCQSIAELEEDICCMMMGSCNNEIVTVDIGDCDTSGSFSVALTISGNAEVSDSFTLRGNGTIYGTFAYIDSMVNLELMGDCQTIYEFVIIDQDDENCQDVYEFFEPICCDTNIECNIAITNLQIGDCNSAGAVPVTLSFAANSAASDTFTLRGNGTVYGQFLYSSSPITLLVDGDCTTEYEFIIIDQSNPNCTDEMALEEPICCDTMSECSIEIYDVEFSDCTEDGFVIVKLQVSANDNSGDVFSLRGNGTSYGEFSYSDTTILLELRGDCQTIYEFIATDGQDANCQDIFEFQEPFCCEGEDCIFSIDDLFQEECEGTTFDISFIYDGSSFEEGLYIDGAPFDSVYFENGTYFITGLTGDGSGQVIVLTDSLNNCIDTIEVSALCPTGLENNELESTKLWSTNQRLFLSSDEAWWNGVKVYNTIGQELLVLNFQSDSYDISQLSSMSGIYFIQVYGEKRKKVFKVFIR